MTPAASTDICRSTAPDTLCYTDRVNPERPPREVGLPHFLLLILTPLAPAFVSGALRSALAEEFLSISPFMYVPLPVGLVLGALVSAACVYWVLARARIRRPNRWAAVGAVVLLVIGALLAWRCLYNPRFDGLVTVGGGDAGQHLVNRYAFLKEPRSTYGTVTFYSVTYWAERAFGLEAFGSFRLAFYVTVATVLLALAASAALVGRCATRKLWTLLLGLFALVTQFILFPLLHYMQAEGFYPQLFSLVPLFVCWAAYGLAERSPTRLLVITIWVAAMRYTYGLNLGDVFGVAAILTGCEAVSLPGGLRRTMCWVLGLAFLAAAKLPYAELVKTWDTPAGVISPFMVLLLAGEALLATALGLLPRFAERAGVTIGPGEKRLAHFACFLGCINLIPPLLYSLSGKPFRYFLLKYNFVPVALLVATAVVLVPFTVPGIVRGALQRQPRSLRRTMAAAIVFPVALLLIAGAYQPYLKTYVQRMRTAPPWRLIGPVADREAMHRIANVLRSENLPFAGLLGASWPLMHFMNGALGEDKLSVTRNWDELANKAMRGQPGCLFWYGGPEELSKLARRSEPGAARLLTRLCQLEELPDKRCESYTVPWSPQQSSLCHCCVRSTPTGPQASPVMDTSTEAVLRCVSLAKGG